MKTYDALFIGVDVGTGSARAALVTNDGKILKTAVEQIQTWNPSIDHFEQSSENIWKACVKVIKIVSEGYPPADVKGLGFDATCSLVVLSKDMTPLTVSLTNNNEQNIILWMDHRAKKETELINNTNNPILKYVGGKVSIEMQMPKLLWLKNNIPSTWKNIGYVFDLPDYLTWRASGSNTRSLCSVVCKWNYEAGSSENMRWNKDYFKQIQLEELLNDDSIKIGNVILPPGAPCGFGLTQMSASELGLLKNTPVGTSIIDAHAGGLGMLGISADNIAKEFDTRLGLICGTSTCHMAVNKNPIFISGIWGPYYSAMVPEFWLNEAGQSASGILIEHIINNHPASKIIKEKCTGGMIIQDYLNQHIINLTTKKGFKNNCYLTKDLHMWPDFHGNRSPVSDPNLLGMISGLTLSNNEDSLALLYLATLQSLAYGTRHIIDHLIKSGYQNFKSLLICGGLAQNKLFVQIQADAVGIPLLCPKVSESVLVGAAILGACGANYFDNIDTAIQKMGGEAHVVHPDESVKDFHNCKYNVFLKMLSDQQEYKQMMSHGSISK